MSDLALRVENPCPERSRRISKLYHIGRAQKRHDTLRDWISDFRLPIFDWGSRVARLGTRNHKSEIENRKLEDSIWALHDVSFEACPERSRRVKRGEVVGIPSTSLRTSIGRNGAGNRKLLKILSRVTELRWVSVPHSGKYLHAAQWGAARTSCAV